MEDKRREYGRQQSNTLTNSMNSIPVDIPPPLRQYLRLSLSGAIKMGTQRKFPRSYDFLADMGKNSHKQVNYNKIKEITQNPDENPPSFLVTSWRQ
jgi:hypothetical protein